MNHDLIGIKDLLKRQKQQINRIKFFTRIDNEKYLREHPEIEFIIQQFLVKLLEDPEKRQKMGEFGRSRVINELSWEHTSKALLEGYDRYFKRRGM